MQLRMSMVLEVPDDWTNVEAEEFVKDQLDYTDVYVCGFVNTHKLTAEDNADINPPIRVCNRCGHLCKPTEVPEYSAACEHCYEDLYSFEFTEYDGAACLDIYLEQLDGSSVRKLQGKYKATKSAIQAILRRGKAAYANPNRGDKPDDRTFSVGDVTYRFVPCDMRSCSNCCFCSLKHGCGASDLFDAGVLPQCDEDGIGYNGYYEEVTNEM